jgi:hypothetical protein
MAKPHTDDAAKAKAEATFKRREEQARDGAIAMAEYRASREATRAKTARLRALRLAKEAEESAKSAARAERP